MIVEKPLPPPGDIAPRQPQDFHVFYASMPEPQVDVDGLSRQLDSGLNVDDQPPSYDSVEHNPARVPTGVDSKHAAHSPSSNSRSLPSFHVANPSPQQPGDAPPRRTSFERPVPELVSRLTQGEPSSPQAVAFAPLILHSKSKKLEDGFFSVPPPTDVNPHPFVQRDVQETDWTR